MHYVDSVCRYGLTSFMFTVDRVRWFRTRAEMEHWEEEVLILCAEFNRTEWTFAFLSHAWKQTATTVIGAKLGYAAFAYKHADMYGHMAKHCRDTYVKFKFEGPGDRSTTPSAGTSMLKQLYLI